MDKPDNSDFTLKPFLFLLIIEALVCRTLLPLIIMPAFFDSSLKVFLETIYLLITLLIAFLVLWWYMKKTGKETFSLNGIDSAIWFWLLLICFSLFAFDMLYRSVGLIQDRQFNGVDFPDRDSTSFWSVVKALRAILYAPIVEEILFRGLLQKQLLKKLSPFVGVLVSSVLFFLWHSNISTRFTVLIIGLALGFIYYRTDKLIICIMVHSFYNLLCAITISVPKYADPLLHYFLFPAVLIVVSIYSVREFLKVTEKKEINCLPDS